MKEVNARTSPRTRDENEDEDNLKGYGKSVGPSRGDRTRGRATCATSPGLLLPTRTVFTKNGKQMAIIVKPVSGFPINL